MVFFFLIKDDIFVGFFFGLVWFLTFGSKSQISELMYNSVADLFF